MAKSLPAQTASRRTDLWTDQASKGFKQFLLRGIDKVKAEWAIICTAHNLTKLARAA
jgi:hypothetical protein